MCGRVIQSSGPLRYAIVDGMNVRDSRFRNYPQRWNGAPSQELLVIRRNHKTGEILLDPLRWGLIPYWCRDSAGGRKPINAKCETVRDLPTQPTGAAADFKMRPTGAPSASTSKSSSFHSPERRLAEARFRNRTVIRPDECPIAEPRLGGAEAGFCARVLGKEEACPPSRHSQLMSRLATTITIPVMSTAKQEKSRRSLRRKRISSPPL